MKMRLLPFDECVPAMMNLIQQDLFGVASEMKEMQDIQRRVTKEAVGVKSCSMPWEKPSRFIVQCITLHAIYITLQKSRKISTCTS
eukprot:11733675-Ditylum_brightwellii.AAC.1